MRHLIVLLIALCSTGCLMEVVTVTAIQGELAAENAQASVRVLGQAKDFKARTELESALIAYKIDKEYYPTTLTDLVPIYIAAIPTLSNGLEFGYDPATGELTEQRLGAEQTSTRQAPAFTQLDAQHLYNIRKAIYDYGQMNGLYPESLDALLPLYIQSLPRMASGQFYPYNNQTGTVSHPGEYQAYNQQGSAGQGTGQPSGSRTAGGQVNSISGGHSQRQLKALDDLGF